MNEKKMLTVTDAVIDVQHISKTYGVTRALSDVSVAIAPGEVHGIVGRNGAGKSTLVSALSGLVRPDSGRIAIRGEQAWGDAGASNRTLFESVAMVHQTPALVDSLSVAENLHLEPDQLADRFGFISWKSIYDDAAELLDQWQLDLDPRQPVGGLSPAERHLLAIARAMARDAVAIILDEPTAALPAAEVDKLFAKLRTLRDQGMAFVYISHHLEEVSRICDRATVLRDGRVIATREGDELEVSDLVTLVAGRSLAANEKSAPRTVASGETPLIRLENVRPIPASTGVSLSIAPGEVHALVGLIGSGAEHLGEVVAGALAPLAGEVFLDGKKLPHSNRPAHVAAGIGYVPSDRHADGYVGILSVRENSVLSALDLISSRFGFVRSGAERELADRAIANYDIKVSDRDQTVESLSGGNQQKVVIARALATAPRVLVAIHPTRGVDVGAKESIYDLLKAFVNNGNAILLVTDELAEADALASTVTVMRHGNAVATLENWSHEDLLLSMEGTPINHA